MAEHTRVANRIHKLLEDANIKLGAVASDVLGVSGRAMLADLVAGETDPVKLAERAQSVLRRKIPQLRLALDGKFTDHHKGVLQRLMTHLEFLESQTASISEAISEREHQMLSDDDIRRLDAIPGINHLTLQNILAEIGPDMSAFPDARHLCSWAGMCPGNEESAGKRLRSATRPGNRWLRRALGEAAWVASRTQDTYFSAQFRRLAARRGKHRAVMAVGHSLLTVIYHVLKDHREYKELGGDYFDRQAPERLERYFVSRLEALGIEVIIRPRTTAQND